MFSPQPREQEFAPLLFSLTPDASLVTPRSATAHRAAGELSMSAQRRSAMTGGSVHTEGTPVVPPPPVISLMDDVTMEDSSMSTGRGQRGAAQRPTAPAFTPPPGPSSTQAAAAPPPPQYDDVWVTVYGFSPGDVPLILKEFGGCGDILQWGTFGAPQANFLHIQYQNKYAAQRALLRDGEQMLPSLIVGVKPLAPRHRAAIAEYGAQDGAAEVQVQRDVLMAERPYRLEKSSVAQQVPQPTRSTFAAKALAYVLGV